MKQKILVSATFNINSFISYIVGLKQLQTETREFELSDLLVEAIITKF